MGKLIFIILLLLPLIGSGQAEKPYQSIRIDSLKALNGGSIDAKDTVKFEKPISIGGSVDASALMTMISTDKGMLIPRMTTAQRDAISSPATGLLIFNTTTNLFEFFETIWRAIGGVVNTIYTADDNLAGNRIISQGGNTLSFTATPVNAFSVDGTTFSVDALNNRVGIGTASPPNVFTVDAALNDAITLRNTSSQKIAQLGHGTSGGVLNLFNSTGSASLVLFNSGPFSFITDGKNFGFGTSSPTNSLVVKTNANDKGIELISATDKLHVLLQSDNTVGGQILIKDAAGTTQLVLFNGGAGPGDGFYNTGGDYIFGGSNATARLHAKGVNASGATSAFLVEDNAGTDLFDVKNDGQVIVGSEFSTTKKDITLGVADITFVTTGNVMEITGDGGGNTITTITGALSGQYLIIIFVDDKVTITDDNGHGANTIDLSAAFTSVDDTVLHLIYNGTSWYEVSRSIN